MLCAKIIEIGSSLLNLFKIKLVTFFETRSIQGGPKKVSHYKVSSLNCIKNRH